MSEIHYLNGNYKIRNVPGNNIKIYTLIRKLLSEHEMSMEEEDDNANTAASMIPLYNPIFLQLYNDRTYIRKLLSPLQV